MGIFDFKKFKCDMRFLICFGIAVLLAIISGIVLHKIVAVNLYFINFTSDYVYCVFHFKNWTLFFSHFISEAFYLYVFLLIAYFIKIKYVVLPVLFVRSLFSVVYCIILCTAFGLGGVMICILIYIPTVLLSLVCSYFIVEGNGCVGKNYLFFLPLALAVAISVVLLLLVNVLFKVVIMIV